jgi:imidazole glycerol-phosphate synthase subunit HisF
MSSTFRIIPRLDIKGNELVKGINLDGLRVLGKPEHFAKKYYLDGADEIFFQDVVASLYDSNSLHSLISRIAKNIFIPLTVGGGIRSVDDINKMLKSGADKVSINTAAVKKPNFIKEVTERFGSSTITISVEVIKSNNGKYLVYTDSGREFTGLELTEWLQTIQNYGAGEIVLTLVDTEGTGKGFDFDLLKKINNKISIPFIVHGGIGSESDVLEVSKLDSINGVCISSIFHYHLVKKYKKVPETFHGNKEFLKTSNKKTFFNTVSIYELKKFLKKKGINIRYEEN